MCGKGNEGVGKGLERDRRGEVKENERGTGEEGVAEGQMERRRTGEGKEMSRRGAGEEDGKQARGGRAVIYGSTRFPLPPPTIKGNYSRELACGSLGGYVIRNRILIVSSATFCLIKSKLLLGNALM
jgi:hypothetical protein